MKKIFVVALLLYSIKLNAQPATNISISSATRITNIARSFLVGTGTSGQHLAISGTNIIGVTGSGGVNSVGLSMPFQFSVSGSPITSSGVFGVTLTNSSGTGAVVLALSPLITNGIFLTPSITNPTVTGKFTFDNLPTNSAAVGNVLKFDGITYTNGADATGGGGVVYRNGAPITDVNLTNSSTLIISSSGTTNTFFNPTNLANAQIASGAAIDKAKISSSGVWTPAELGTGTADDNGFLRGDGTWVRSTTDGQVVRLNAGTLSLGAVDLANGNAVSGILADGNLSANVALLNAANIFTTTNRFPILFAFSGTFSNLTSGRVPVVGANGIITNYANFTYDSVNDKLTIANVGNQQAIDVGTTANGKIRVFAPAANTLGAIQFMVAGGAQQVEIGNTSGTNFTISPIPGTSVFIDSALTIKSNLTINNATATEASVFTISSGVGQFLSQIGNASISDINYSKITSGASSSTLTNNGTVIFTVPYNNETTYNGNNVSQTISLLKPEYWTSITNNTTFTLADFPSTTNRTKLTTLWIYNPSTYTGTFVLGGSSNTWLSKITPTITTNGWFKCWFEWNGTNVVGQYDGQGTNVLTADYGGTGTSNGDINANNLVVTNSTWLYTTNINYSGGTNLTLDLSNGAKNIFYVTLTNTTFFTTPSGVPASVSTNKTIYVFLKQDATGARSVTWTNATFKFPGGTVPTITTNANAVDLITLTLSPFTAGQLYGVATQDIK